MMHSVTVVYLVWLPYGPDLFKAFLESYQRFGAGYNHRLLIYFNGVNNPSDIRNYVEWARNKQLDFDYQSATSGQDIDIYFSAARSEKADYILFLNSFSQIQAQDWLGKYMSVIKEYNGRVLLSATGSYQSHYSSVFVNHKIGWEKGKNLAHHFGKYKLFVKAFFYWRFLFPSFPNAHLRTNAFIVDRKVFIEIDPGPLVKKFNAYKFESGRKGLTRFFEKKGYKICILGKDGIAYEPSNWPVSKTFWKDGQENLLISDNQTRIYDAASPVDKMEMTKSAWGNYA